MASSGIPRTQLIRLSLWISTMLERKRSFKLLISNVTSVDVIREEARSTFVLAACSESSTSADRITPQPQVGKSTWQRKTSVPRRALRDYWKELNSVCNGPTYYILVIGPNPISGYCTSIYYYFIIARHNTQ